MQRLAFWCAQTKGMQTTGLAVLILFLQPSRVSSGVACEDHSATQRDPEKWPGGTV